MLNGKGMFIWQIARTEGGDPALIADLAQAAQFTHVLIKIADGTSSYNITTSGVDLVPPLVQALMTRGIEPWGWHYVYGDSPSAEANKAIQRVQETGVVGYVIDAESEYKLPGKDVAAISFMTALRNGLPFFPVALSSYRYPSLHPELPWQEFLSRCDYAMPQVYWIQAHDPAQQLARCLGEYRLMTTLPIVPTGAAFTEGNWSPSAAEVVAFMDAALAQNLSGVNFWEWYTARQLASVWDAIRTYDWPIALPPPPPQPVIVRGRVWATTLNVRSGPGSEFPQVGSLKAGTRVTVFDLHRAWVKISADSERWVYSYYLDRVTA